MNKRRKYVSFTIHTTICAWTDAMASAKAPPCGTDGFQQIQTIVQRQAHGFVSIAVCCVRAGAARVFGLGIAASGFSRFVHVSEEIGIKAWRNSLSFLKLRIQKAKHQLSGSLSC